MPHEPFEGIAGDLDVMGLAIVGAQARQVDMHRAAAGAMAFQTLQVAEQQVFLAHRRVLGQLGGRDVHASPVPSSGGAARPAFGRER